MYNLHLWGVLALSCTHFQKPRHPRTLSQACSHRPRVCGAFLPQRSVATCLLSTCGVYLPPSVSSQTTCSLLPCVIRSFPTGPADSWLRWEGPWGQVRATRTPTCNARPGARGGGEVTCPRLCRDSAALPSLPDCWEPARAQGCRPASNMHRPAQGGNLSSCEGGQRPRGAPVLGRLLCQKRPSGFGVAFSCVCPSAQPHRDCAGRGLPVPCCLGGESVRRGQGLGPALGSPTCCL